MSTHAIEIIQIGAIEPHPDSSVERMEITHVWGWQCCVSKGQFKPGDKAIYIPPDYNVPTSHPSFLFLCKEGKTQERICVRRFRGALSQGLLISVPPEMANLPVGTDVIDLLGIERYEPPISTGGMFVGAPSDLYAPKFDVENMQRHMEVFTPGEEVIATEKIHGANARYSFAQNKDGHWVQFCGTRINWLAEDDENIWWMALRQNPSIGEWCHAHAGMILYGEVFGKVRHFKYGAKQNQIFFAAFAVLHQNNYLDYDVARPVVEAAGVSWVPLLYRGPYSPEKAFELAEGNSTWPGANHIREGVCIHPVKERCDPNIGRVILKVVSNEHLEKGKE